MPFESCPSLVANRSVVLNGGWARLTSAEQMAHVISSAIAAPDWLESRQLPLNQDSRLAAVAKGHIKRLWESLASTRVPVERLGHHAPCIQRMLETAPHLNFQARRVYGSYAATAGIPVSTSLSVWKLTWQKHYKERAAQETKVIEKFWEFQSRNPSTKSPTCFDVMELGLCPFISASNKVGVSHVYRSSFRSSADACACSMGDLTR